MKKFFLDFLTYGFAGILGKLAAIFLMPIYTSVLTKEEYGAMALITSCKGIIDLLSNLNIHSGIARDYYEVEDRKKELVSTGFLSILSISTIVCVFILFTRNYWAIDVLSLEKPYLSAFSIMVLSIPFGSFLSYFSILTRFKKKPILYAIGSVSQLILQIMISVYCVVFMRTGILGIFLGLMISEIFAIVYFAYINREFIGLLFDSRILIRALRFCIPTLPAILAGWIDTSVGQIIIGKYISKGDLGVYSIALSIASAFTLVGLAFRNVWSPFLYENYKKESFQNDINKLFAIFIIVLSCVTVILSIFSKEIILLLSNSSYIEASKYLTILCLPMSVYILFPFVSSGVSISRDTKYVGISYIAGSIMNVIGLSVLISYLGIIAVPLSLSFSRFTTYAFLYKASERQLQYKLPNNYLIILLMIVAFIYFIIYLDCSFVVRSFICLFILALLCYSLNKVIDIRVMFRLNVINKIKKHKI